MILPICIHFVGHPSIEQVREQKDFCWTNSLVSEDEDVKCRLKLLQKLHDFFAFLVKNTSVYLKNIYQLFLRRWTSEYMVTGYSRKANTSIFATQPLFKSRTFLLEMASLRLLRVPLYIHTFWMFCIWVFPKIGVPQNRWFIMEKNLLEWMIRGETPLFLETPIYCHPKYLFHLVVAILMFRELRLAVLPGVIYSDAAWRNFSPNEHLTQTDRFRPGEVSKSSGWSIMIEWLVNILCIVSWLVHFWGKWLTKQEMYL